MKETIYPSGRPMLDSLSDMEDLWVFGYGSLIWNPGFDSVEERVGYIEDYSRKFWQGNVTHRGTPAKIGRVVTLVKQLGSRVWGKAYRVVGTDQITKCLEHLGVRECLLGGYDIDMIDFIPNPHHNADDSSSDASDMENDDSSDDFPSPLFDLDDVFSSDVGQYSSRSPSPDRSPVEQRQKIQTLVFIALPENRLFLGPAASDEMADCFMTCSGANGSNLDYMLGILDFLQDKVPSEELVHERELLEIERQVWFQVQTQSLEALARRHGGFLKPSRSESSSSADVSFSCLDKATNSRRLRHRNGMFTPLLDTIKTAVLLKNYIDQQSSSSWSPNHSSPASSALNVQFLWNNPSSLGSSFVSDGESLVFSDASNPGSVEEENGFLVPCFCRPTAISLPRRTEENRL